MTWNLRHFAPFKLRYADTEKTLQQEAIRREVESFKPDVVCFQEFVNIPLSDGTDVIGKIMEEHGFKDMYFAGDRLNMRKFKTGMAIFSKYPLLNPSFIEYPAELEQTGEKSIKADIGVGGDTVRIYSIHLQSFGFAPRDYWAFRRIRTRSDSGLASARSLLAKMKQTFEFHSREAQHVASVIDDGPRHHVVCGDLNDVPASYAYRVIRADRRDVHLEKGAGLGKTYTSPSSRTMGKLPTLRIDYIFTDPAFETVQSTRGPALLSDHQAVVADIRLTQKK
jgi:endonuclease/exonuclease/phosphatase family metal-dependent hydrolase